MYVTIHCTPWHGVRVLCKYIFVVCLCQCAAVQQHICHGNEIYIFKHWLCFLGCDKKKQQQNKWCCCLKKRNEWIKSTPIRIKNWQKKCDRKIMLVLFARRVKYYGIIFYLLELELVLLPHMLCGFLNCSAVYNVSFWKYREHNYQWILKWN